jgi:hypothetical protein
MSVYDLFLSCQELVFGTGLRFPKGEAELSGRMRFVRGEAAWLKIAPGPEVLLSHHLTGRQAFTVLSIIDSSSLKRKIRGSPDRVAGARVGLQRP